MDTSRSLSRSITPKLRIVGVDDGAFALNKRKTYRTSLVGVLFDGIRIVAVRAGRIRVDGTDAGFVIGELLRGLVFDGVMLSGISFGGFNLVDIGDLARKLRRPVIAISGERPDNQAVRAALRLHFTDWNERWTKVRAAGRLYSLRPLRTEPELFFEVRGATPTTAKKMIAATTRISRLPEPIRVARILARALSGTAGAGLT